MFSIALTVLGIVIGGAFVIVMVSCVSMALLLSRKNQDPQYKDEGDE